MPFLWSAVATQGTLRGNADAGSSAGVQNGYRFSYPGYNEILTGFADPRIDRNSYRHPALGERRNAPRVTESQISATVAALVGMDWRAAQPQAAPHLKDALGGN